jgi:nitrite reductase (NADH) large subunit
MKPVVVVGNGMVAQKFLEAAVAKNVGPLMVIGEESRPAYDRVALSSWFDGATADDLSMVPEGFYEASDIDVRLGQRVVSIDRAKQQVTTSTGDVVEYSRLVLSTGSYPFVPPVDGCDAPGCFVYRTIDDLEAIESYAMTSTRGVVVGGGLLGLEAANALRLLGLEAIVVEFASRPLAVQLDDRGGRALRRRIEDLGIPVRCNSAATAVMLDDDGSAKGLQLADGAVIDADMVIFAAGVRPRDELGRCSDLEVGERGGIVIDDVCTTSDPNISAIGEVACHRGRVYGLVAPGYDMAEVLADSLVGGTRAFIGGDMSAKLKLLGVDVASFGNAQADGDGYDELIWNDPTTNGYARLVLDAEGCLVGGMLVGDTSNYLMLAQMAKGAIATPANLAAMVLPTPSGDKPIGLSITDVPDATAVCSCHNVTKGAICATIRHDNLTEIGAVKKCTKAGTGCGSCVSLVQQLLNDEMRKAGHSVHDYICEHFDHSRQELFDLVRVHGIATFSDLIAHHGRGRGCEVCKPAVASMLASLANGHILNREQASIQDTNDHFLANLQRDGSYSVVPRVPGGEITPQQLIVLGEVARDFDLYSKITGGQRVDLFGARVEQLPAIWERLIAAGFESGHAYGKALRTIKSCVGTTWCRYGVQDAVGLAIQLELRYRGLRAPHKLKSAVSGCARECAEAQSKDFGIIATERGWNLYLCGNGGMRPQHAVLFAEDLDTDTLIRYLDRFLMFYIRTADRLERTAPWFNKLEGGIDYLRSVVIDDRLDINAELEADMAKHVTSYQCEWKGVLEDPEKLAQFRSFINADEPDGSMVYIRERGQKRPAHLHELEAKV